MCRNGHGGRQRVAGIRNMDLYIEDWFRRQYVTEYQTRRSVATATSYSMIRAWRCEPHISVWTCLPGEKPPAKLISIPIPTLHRHALEAWTRCDKTKARELYDMWNHHCTDPYYCPMHGIGSS